MKNTDIARVTAAVVAAVDSHRPSHRSIESNSEHHRVAFDTWIFDARAGSNWGVYRGIGRGWVDVKPLPPIEATDVEITSTLFVARGMVITAFPVVFFTVVMILSGWWLAASIAVCVLPIWATLFAEAYVGTFQRSLQKALDKLADDPRRGFDVVEAA